MRPDMFDENQVGNAHGCLVDKRSIDESMGRNLYIYIKARKTSKERVYMYICMYVYIYMYVCMRICVCVCPVIRS